MAELRRRRFAAQGLAGGGPRSPVDVVRRLLAVQAQDPRAFPLALRARAPGLHAAEIDAALEAGTLVVTWLMRGTLHLVHRDDYLWLRTLTAPPSEANNRRRLGEEGVSPPDAERALTIIEATLREGPATRAELAERIGAAGIRTERQAMPHLLGLASLRGLVVQGARQRFVLVADPPRPLSDQERTAAVVELVRRYLRGHGPATAADVATWSGLGLRDIRAAFATLDPSQDNGPAPRNLPARLLPAFDPYLLGWRDRSFAVPDEHRRAVYPGGGMLRATVTVDGRAVGTWSLAGGRVRLTPFAPFDEAALAAEVADVERFVQAGTTPAATNTSAPA